MTFSTRLAALRQALIDQNLDGFLIPRTNTHQLEYVPSCDERLAWLTGFTGSAGTALILKSQAVLFTDGRYAIQAAQEIDTQAYQVVMLPETSLEKWIELNVPPLSRLGYDPRLHTPSQVEKLRKGLEAAGAECVAVEHNPIDDLWENRPAEPCAPVNVHPLIFAGEVAEAKIERVQAALGAQKCAALLVSDPHNLAWLLNIRGGDVPHTPLPIGYVIVPLKGRPTLFINLAKIDDTVRRYLEPLTDIALPEALETHITTLAATRLRIRCDKESVNQHLVKLIESAKGIVDEGDDPITLMKAVKNSVEMQGAGDAHIRDGAAMCRFLAWLEREFPKRSLTEMDIADHLEQCRQETGLLKDLSFPTIAGSGANGAIVHYRATRGSQRVLQNDDLVLIDSGAQYQDGTTDITRTVVMGTPSQEIKERYTQVLKGHIALASAVFPKGTQGVQLDGLARQFLWQSGCDYDHGTGHGVGSYLSVHEGPQRISKMGKVPLEAGMILSNEPGYYKAGAYGIRLENLILVTPCVMEGAERAMLCFETLTLCPFDARLIMSELLSTAEREWLHAYHTRVYDALSPLLDEATKAWLEHQTLALTTSLLSPNVQQNSHDGVSKRLM
jgi:Xaa-Pro aminopeptidase